MDSHRVEQAASVARSGEQLYESIKALAESEIAKYPGGAYAASWQEVQDTAFNLVQELAMRADRLAQEGERT